MVTRWYSTRQKAESNIIVLIGRARYNKTSGTIKEKEDKKMNNKNIIKLQEHRI